MKRLFISYSRANKATVDELVGRLPGLGYQAWVDSVLHGGQSWWEEILSQIGECDAFIAIVSRDSLSSVACQRELEWALALNRPILPVAVEHLVQALPRELSMRQIVDYSQPGQDAAFALFGALAALPAAPAPPEVLPEPPAAPLSYLTDLVEQVSQSAPLTHEQQRNIVNQLQPGLRSADPEEHQATQYILDRFTRRDDLYADVYRMLDLLRAEGVDTHTATPPHPPAAKARKNVRPTEPQAERPPPPEQTPPPEHTTPPTLRRGWRGWAGRRKQRIGIGIAVTALVIIAAMVVSVYLVRGTTADRRDVAGQSGDPVKVNDVHTYWPPTTGLDVVMPKGLFKDSQLPEVNSIDSPDAKADWLVQHGAAPVGKVFISIAVSGNRPDGVRIVDVRPIKQCSIPYAGAIFLLPAQGGDTSIGLEFDLDQVDPKPMYRNDSNEALPYFPDRTISLRQGEEQILLVEARTEKQACSFRLEMTVLEGNKRLTQEISDSNGRPFRVSAMMENLPYEAVYMNTLLCFSPDVGYVRAPSVGSGLRCEFALPGG